MEGVQETLDLLGDDFRFFRFLVCFSRARWCADTSIWARIVLVCVVLVLVFTAVRVRVRIRVFGQGLRLSLRGSGAHSHAVFPVAVHRP